MGREDMSTKKPMVLVLAGPNGSGKSTITQYFEIVGSYTNADEVVAVTGIGNEDAARLVDEKRYGSIKKAEDFTFETVLSSKYKLDILEKAKRPDILHVYDNTVEPVRIIRKHKEDVSIFLNELWSEENIRKLIEEAAE